MLYKANVEKSKDPVSDIKRKKEMLSNCAKRLADWKSESQTVRTRDIIKLLQCLMLHHQ